MNRDHLPGSLRRVLERIDHLILTAPPPVRDQPHSLQALYLSHCQHELQMTPQSLRQQYYYSRYILRWFAERNRRFPADVRAADIEAFLAFQRDIRGNSLTQQRHYLDTLRRFCRLLCRERLIDEDPTEPFHLKTPIIQNIHRILNLQQLHELLQAARADRDQAPSRYRDARTRDAALISLLATTGCRLAEALALIRCRIGPQTRHAFFPGKGDFRHAVRERVVPLEDPQVRHDIDLWLARRPTEPDTLVFVTASGRPLEPHQVLYKLRRLGQLAGIPHRVSPHDLRATFASRLVENGIDPLALQQLMGHTDLATTLTLYVKLDVNTLHQAWRRSNPLASLTDGPDDEHG